MTTTRRLSVPLVLAIVAGLSAPGLPGCGEAEPPPVSQEQFDAAKKDREVIIQKEYGSQAFQKGQAAEKARNK
jgi:hypothetical protein